LICLRYCAFHHQLLFLADRYPEIAEEASKRYQAFRDKPGWWLHDPSSFNSLCRVREKKSTPDLGKFLVLLTLTGGDETWEAIAISVRTKLLR
jgi:hypothetical protein